MQCISGTTRTIHYVCITFCILQSTCGDDTLPWKLSGCTTSLTALFAWIEEVGQNLQIFLSRRNNFAMTLKKLTWPVLILHNWNNQEIRKVGLSETHASGNQEASTHNDWWKAHWWNQCWWGRSRWTWNDEVFDYFLKGVPNPDDELILFCQDGYGVMNVDFFLDRVFLTEFFWGFVHM